MKVATPLPGQGKFGSKPNYFSALVSITLILFLLEIAGFFLLHTRHLISFYKENLQLIVEIREGTGEEEVEKLGAWLSRQVYCKPTSVRHIDKETAMQWMRHDFGEDFLKLDLPNPFLDVLTFNLRESYLEQSRLRQIRATLEDIPAVRSVFFQDSFLQSLLRNMRRIAQGSLVLGGVLLLISIVLIFNTLKLALHSQRFLIKNMELVGASWSFISLPFLRRSFIHGLLAGLLATSAFGLSYIWLQGYLPELTGNLPLRDLWVLGIAIVATGVFIYVFSTFMVVNRYLQLRVDDLY